MVIAVLPPFHRKICTVYSSKDDKDDNVCPWEEEGGPSSRHNSKESPTTTGGKAAGGADSHLVRRGSDPTLLTSSKGMI